MYTNNEYENKINLFIDNEPSTFHKLFRLNGFDLILEA